MVALVLDDPARWQQAQQVYAVEDIADPLLRRILEVVCELAATGHPATPAHVVSRLLDEGEGGPVAELVELAQSLSSKEEAFDDCLRRLRAEAGSRTRAQLREHIRTAHEAGQDVEVQRLLAEYQRHLPAPPVGGAAAPRERASV